MRSLAQLSVLSVLAASSAAVAAPPRKPARPPSAPAVASGATVAPGTPTLSAARLEVARVSAALAPRTTALRTCYRTLLAALPGSDIDATLRFVIDGRGRVRGGALTADAAFTEQAAWTPFERCVTRAIAAVRFPKPTGGASVAVRYPLQLRANAPAELPAPGGLGVEGNGAGGLASPGAPRAVTIGEASGPDAPYRAAVRRYVVLNTSRMAACQRIAEAGAAPTGTVTATFTIDADGRVTSASASGVPALDACVARGLKLIEFPRPQAGPVVVRLPVTFAAAAPR